MADFASLIYGTAQNAAQDVGKGMPAAVVQGAELAQKNEQLQLQKMELDQKKQQLAQAKVEKIYDFVKEANKYTNASDRQAYMKNAIGMRNAMGVDQNAMPDEMLMRLGTNENMQRMYTLDSAVAAGQMSRADALELATNPLKADQFAKIAPTPLELMGKRPDLNEAQKEFMDRQSREKVAGERSTPFADRVAQGVHKDALNALIAPSSNISKLKVSYQNIDNALTNFVHGGRTANEFAELQQSIRANAGIKGTGGVEERAQTYAKATGIDAAKWMQWLTGSPQDIAKVAPEIVKNIENIARIEMQNKRQQADTELGVLTKGHRSFYKKNPDLGADYDATVNETRSAFQKGGSVDDTVNFGGKPVSRSALQSYIQLHPTNADIPAAKAALGVK